MQFRYLKYDLYRYFYPNDNSLHISIKNMIGLILSKQGIWALCVYRFRRWVLYECKNSFLRVVLRPIGLILHLLIEITTGIRIPPETDIGPGLYIAYFGGIILGVTKIGKLCNINQQCTIGYAGRGEKRGIPIIGDFVNIAAGAKVLGKIRIGNNVMIGANAVVTKDVPDNAVVAGVPAKVISYKSSKDFVHFNGEKNREIL